MGDWLILKSKTIRNKFIRILKAPGEMYALVVFDKEPEEKNIIFSQAFFRYSDCNKKYRKIKDIIQRNLDLYEVTDI